MSEQQTGPSSGERLAEVMAWHGMARYADPDDLAGYVRPAGTDGPGEEPEPPVRP